MKSEAERQRVIQCLEAAIERRVSEVKACDIFEKLKVWKPVLENFAPEHIYCYLSG